MTCRSSPLSSHETDTLRRSHRARPGPRYSDHRRTALTIYCVGAECVIFCFLKLPTGSLAQDATDLSQVSDYFQQLKDRMTDEFTALINNPALQQHAE